MTFQLIKNVIIEQNKVFLIDLANKFKLDPDVLMKTYIKPEYYLPIIVHSSGNNSLQQNSKSSKMDQKTSPKEPR